MFSRLNLTQENIFVPFRTSVSVFLNVIHLLEHITADDHRSISVWQASSQAMLPTNATTNTALTPHNPTEPPPNSQRTCTKLTEKTLWTVTDTCQNRHNQMFSGPSHSPLRTHMKRKDVESSQSTPTIIPKRAGETLHRWGLRWNWSNGSHYL